MRSAALLFRPSVGAAAVLGLALFANACGGSSRTGKTPNDVSHAGLRAASSESKLCEDIRSEACARAMRDEQEIVGLFDLFALVGDVRSLPLVKEGLATENAEIQVAALRLLGKMRCPDGAADLALPFVTSGHPAIRELALEISTCGDKANKLRDQYRIGHPKAGALYAARAVDRVPDEEALGFPGLGAEAVAYPMGDSSISEAFTVAGGVEDVVKDLVARGHGKEGSAEDIAVALTAGSAETQAARAAMVKRKVDDLLAKVQAGTIEQTTAERELRALMDANPSRGKPLPLPTEGDVKGISLTDDGKGNVARAAFVYREPLLDKTVVVFAWDGWTIAPIERGPQDLAEYIALSMESPR